MNAETPKPQPRRVGWANQITHEQLESLGRTKREVILGIIDQGLAAIESHGVDLAKGQFTIETAYQFGSEGELDGERYTLPPSLAIIVEGVVSL